VVQVVIVIAAAGRNVRYEHEAHVDRRRIAAYYVARQFLPDQPVEIGDAQVGAIWQHLAGRDKCLGIDRVDAGRVTGVALVGRIGADRDVDIESPAVRRIPPQTRGGDGWRNIDQANDWEQHRQPGDACESISLLIQHVVQGSVRSAHASVIESYLQMAFQGAGQGRESNMFVMFGGSAPSDGSSRIFSADTRI
jgi:hypothetical protein